VLIEPCVKASSLIISSGPVVWSGRVVNVVVTEYG